MSFVDEYAGAKPIPKGRIVAPFKDFPDEKRREIAEAVLADKPPPRWLNFVGAQIESRAWYEWHWHRGINPNAPRLDNLQVTHSLCNIRKGARI